MHAAARSGAGHRAYRIRQVDTLAAWSIIVTTNRPDHIITIEDPIEFVHESKRCLVNQREVHRDTLGSAEALSVGAARRPRCGSLVGEMRDLETIPFGPDRGGNRHLVFVPWHTSSAAKTIDRIGRRVPGSGKGHVRAMMSESPKGGDFATLMKRVGGGRIAAHEIMIGTPAIRNLIREGKIAQMYSAIQNRSGPGMQTLESVACRNWSQKVLSAVKRRSTRRRQGLYLMRYAQPFPGVRAEPRNPEFCGGAPGAPEDI